MSFEIILGHLFINILNKIKILKEIGDVYMDNETYKRYESCKHITVENKCSHFKHLENMGFDKGIIEDKEPCGMYEKYECDDKIKDETQKHNNLLTVEVKVTEIDEVKDIISSFIFMLEDSRIDLRIREQYLEGCKALKDSFYINLNRK